jgi:IclR family transcriptional regulator, blcABC operon repressor
MTLNSTVFSASTAVPALDRSVGILNSLAQARQPLSLATIARQIDIPKSSAHNLMASLVRHQLAQRDGEGNFSLGSKIEGTSVTYLACNPGSRALAVNFKVGGRFTASCTSSGKAIMSTWDDQAVKALYAGSTKLDKLTRHSIGNINTLCKDLAQVRERGFAIDDEETAEGMQCFGAPVFKPNTKTACAGVAVSLIKAAITLKRRAEVTAAISLLAVNLSKRLAAQA